MLISRQLRIALLVSFIWHFFWISFVSIVNLPNKLGSGEYPAVSFLGSILKNSLSVKQASAAHKKHFGDLPSGVDIHAQGFFCERPDTNLSAEREILNPDGFIDIDTPGAGRIPFANFVSAEELTSQREIIFQPPFSKYPEWSQQEFRANFAIFKIYICPDGLVEQVINEQASGSPEIDAALARYVRKWRFAPAEKQQGDWQTVEINLEFK